MQRDVHTTLIANPMVNYGMLYSTDVSPVQTKGDDLL
jgi:hypothetical protein